MDYRWYWLLCNCRKMHHQCYGDSVERNQTVFLLLMLTKQFPLVNSLMCCRVLLSNQLNHFLVSTEHTTLLYLSKNMVLYMPCFKVICILCLITQSKINHFYPLDSMLVRVLAVAWCLCLSHVGFYRNGRLYWFVLVFNMEALSNQSYTLFWEIQVSRKIRVLPSGTLS